MQVCGQAMKIDQKTKHMFSARYQMRVKSTQSSSGLHIKLSLDDEADTGTVWNNLQVLFVVESLGDEGLTDTLVIRAKVTSCPLLLQSRNPVAESFMADCFPINQA